jgi:hypothetical protein
MVPPLLRSAESEDYYVATEGAGLGLTGVGISSI